MGRYFRSAVREYFQLILMYKFVLNWNIDLFVDTTCNNKKISDDLHPIVSKQ